MGPGLVTKRRFPHRRVESLREVLANLAYKLRRLLMLARAWLSSWSYGHVVAGSDVVLLCWSWQHYSHGDSSSAVLCNVASIMVFAVVSRFPGALFAWSWQHCSQGDSSSAVLCNVASTMVFAVPRVGSRPRSLFTWSLHGAKGHNLNRWGRGTP